MPHISRYKLRDSDRDGATRKEISMVKQGPFKIGPDEFDSPPPSKQPLGGEGDVSANPRANSDFATAGTAKFTALNQVPTFYITAGGGITYASNQPWMYVAGSNLAVDISANPQISAGQQGNPLTLVCVGSDITLDNGTGLALMGSARFVMNSGSIITFLYQSGGTVWWETSRSQRGAF